MARKFARHKRVRHRRHKKKTTVKALSRRIARVEKLEHSEVCVLDWITAQTPSGYSATDTMGYLYPFNTIPVAPTIATSQFGTGENMGNYEGQGIMITGLDWKYRLISGDTNNVVTVFLFWDSDCLDRTHANYVLPNANDILGDYTGSIASPATNPSYMSSVNSRFVGKGNRFQVLYKKTHRLVAASESETVYVHKFFKFNKEMDFAVNSATSGSSPSQAFIIGYISDSGVSPNPTISTQMRLFYLR